MNRPPRTASRSGFTLIEGLLSAALIGVVLAIGTTAFGQMFRAGDITRSKLQAEDDAQRALQNVASLLERCHVIFFSAYPLKQDPPTTNDAKKGGLWSGESWANIKTALAGFPTVPATLLSAANGNRQYRVLAPANAADRTPWTSGTLTTLNTFRFLDPTTVTTARPLQSRLPADNVVKGFNGPLLYAAEAIFDWTNLDGKAPQTALPMAWNIYVLYLAPTPPDSHDPNLATDKDLGDNSWSRSTVPLQLHLLTIPYVKAGVDTTGTPPTGANPGWTWGAVPNGRKLTGIEILPPPNDYAPEKVNYDPVPLPWGPNGGVSMRGAGASGPRVRDTTHANAHGNFNNIGNDPPNEAALGNRIGGQPTDHVIVGNIDPDSLEGTTIKLGNTVGEDSGHALSSGSSRRFLNAYGGEFAYNFYSSLYTAAALPAKMFDSTGQAGGGTGAIPRRAYVSISLRYRNRGGIPFQFATVSKEVDLTPLVSYQRKLLEDLQ